MDALGPDGNITCKTLWISDIHLGNVHCKAEYLLQLLQRVHCARIYLVGDIVDVWSMHRKVHWPETHNAVLRELLKKSRSGVEIIYIPGNHDENFREFVGNSFGNVTIHREAVHLTGKGKRMLVIHGDELDFAVRYSRFTRIVGDVAYDLVMMISRAVHRWRALTGRPYWSLAGWLNKHVSQADQAIRAYQEAAVHLARDRGFDGIICGHLHHPVVQEYGDVIYCNDGDWVENCTALLEDAAGNLQLVRAIGHSDRNRDMVVATAQVPQG